MAIRDSTLQGGAGIIMLTVYCATSVLVLVVSYVVCRRWINPLSAYAGVWLLVILLYQLRLSRLQPEISDRTYSVFLAALCSFTYLFCCSSLLRLLPARTPIRRPQMTHARIVYLFFFWIIVELFEMIYSGGLPVFWYAVGSEKSYFDFGIPSLHGLMNSVGLVVVLLATYQSLVENNRKRQKQYIGIIVFIIFYYLCLITRQVIICAIIEIFVVLLLIKPKIVKRYILPITIVGVIVFGIIGNFRTGYEAFLNVSLIDTDINPMLIGVYWVYMYLTMTVANINNLLSFPPMNLGASVIFNQYLPSVISDVLTQGHLLEDTSMYLVSQAFNVSGYFVNFYMAYGVLGVILIAGLYGLCSGIAFKMVRYQLDERAILIYAVMMQIVLLSFFYNHL